MCAAAVPGLYRRSAPHPAPLGVRESGAVDHLHDRRLFLRAAAAAGVAWAAADLVQVEAALDWSAQHAATSAHAAKSASLSVLTRAQADVVDALSVAHPARRSTGDPARTRPASSTSSIARSPRSTRHRRPFYVDGIADLNRRAAGRVAGSRRLRRADTRTAGRRSCARSNRRRSSRPRASTPSSARSACRRGAATATTPAGACSASSTSRVPGAVRLLRRRDQPEGRAMRPACPRRGGHRGPRRSAGSSGRATSSTS